MICNLDLEGYVGCGKRLSAMLCLVIISLWFIHPASAGAAGSEVPAEEKKEAVVPASAGATESEVPAEEKKEAVVNKKLRTKSGGRFLPIPIFLTEPAFGYGLGVALGYIHPTKEDTETQEEPSLQTLGSVTSERSGQKTPPTITGVAGGYTAKDTWGAAVAHSTSWRKDTIRYAGGLAYVDINSTYYIIDRSLDFNLKGAALYQDLKFRLGKSRFFLGGKLLVLETESQFDITLGEDTEIGADDIQSLNVGVAASATFDTRDNVFTPNNGQLIQFDIFRFDEALGGDFDYWKGNLKLLSFYQLHSRFVLGLSVAASTMDGSAPLYAYPWVSMRGIPALRYQGKSAGTIEVEGRWNILPRWAIVGFAGAGVVYSREISGFNIVNDDIFAGGAGVRYFMMRDLGLWLGVDVAQGPEDWYAYITVGQAW